MMGNHLRNLMSDVSDTPFSRWSEAAISSGCREAGLRREACGQRRPRDPQSADGDEDVAFLDPGGGPGKCRLGAKTRHHLGRNPRLESIVRDFLEFSRPRTLDCRPQDVGAVIDQTLELLGPRFQGEKIRITYAPRPALPPVMADAAQLKQVLLNLLGNAADAMAGGGEIRITSNAEKDADGRPMVVVRISDTGPGMPKTSNAGSSKPFFTTKEQGTGLGLCIAAQVMARHGGGLVLESSTEKGTTFAVWMPVAPEPILELLAMPKILVVDDERNVLRAFEDILQAGGTRSSACAAAKRPCGI